MHRYVLLSLCLPLAGCDLLSGLFDDGSGGVPYEPLDTGAPELGAPFPIVLAHGFFGFDDFAGLGFLTYFYDVVPYLADHGEYEVFTPTVDPFASSTVRGQQLLDEVEAILALTGATKVNLIGHSQGGLDARYVAHHRPDLVASVTTVATPHGGTIVADIVVGLVPFDGIQDIADAILAWAGAPIWDQLGQETSLFDSLDQLSTHGMDDFNATITDAPGIAYYSIAGTSDWHPGGQLCAPPHAPPFVQRWQGRLDPIDPLFFLTEPILDGGPFAPFPNDGLVRVEDAIHGVFLGCIPADHTDQIGQVLGDIPGLFNDFDHREFFADLVEWLRLQGY